MSPDFRTTFFAIADADVSVRVKGNACRQGGLGWLTRFRRRKLTPASHALKGLMAAAISCSS